MFRYPLDAALNSKKINKVYVSTDCNIIKKSKEKDAQLLIDRKNYVMIKLY